jgi:hypothetical protein
MTPPLLPRRKPSVLTHAAQAAIAAEVARRAPSRPRDSVVAQLNAAYRDALATDASPDQNHHAGFIAANAKAYSLRSTVTDSAALAHIASEIVR